jgi:hypothetical protein
MSTFSAHWAFCGGWAVDAWLGRQTREHGDVDISIFDVDQGALFEHLSSGWELIAHDPNVPDDTAEPWTGRRLDLPAHVHARRRGTGDVVTDRLNSPNDAGFGLDIQLGQLAGDDWLVSVEPHIAVPAADCAEKSSWGLPAVVPEILLAFKALELRPRDDADFDALGPRLAGAQRETLQRWLRLIDRGHPWLEALQKPPRS